MQASGAPSTGYQARTAAVPGSKGRRLAFMIVSPDTDKDPA